MNKKNNRKQKGIPEDLNFLNQKGVVCNLKVMGCDDL